MKKRNKNILYAVFILSIIGNIITISLDTYPYLYPKVKNKYFPENTLHIIERNTSELILDQSVKMAESDKVYMIWSEPKGVTSELMSINSSRKSNELQTYNFPKAFLLYGISEYLINKQDEDKLIRFKIIFDKLIDNNGEPSFSLNRIDQAPFGLAALNLYEVFKEDKYLKFSDRLYEYILESNEDDGIIPYRKGSPIIYEDVLGMAVPFLLEYYQLKKDESILRIAEEQMIYYINYGVDKETFLPTHAVNREEKIKIGPTNWGRGIGWYYIALANYYHYTGDFEEEYLGLTNTLQSLRNSDNLWSQFPGGTDKFDASATTMFMYSMLLNDKLFYSNKQELLELLKPYISSKGEILQTSGDTYGLNNYSHSFGKSELSQGFLLLALSLIEG